MKHSLTIVWLDDRIDVARMSVVEPLGLVSHGVR